MILSRPFKEDFNIDEPVKIVKINAIIKVF